MPHTYKKIYHFFSIFTQAHKYENGNVSFTVAQKEQNAY